MSGPNFTLVSELQTQTRRDFPLADASLLQPFNSNPLVDGEFLELDTNYKMARGTVGVGATVEGSSALQFPLFTERGRYDTQAIGKATFLMFGMYEAETAVATLAGLALGDALTVQNVTFQSLTRRGLAKQVAAAGTGIVVVGYVSKIMTGKVRFVHFANQKLF